MKPLKVCLVFFTVLLFTGCPFLLNYFNFDGTYKINGKTYKSISHFNEGLFLNSSFCKAADKLIESTTTESDESCKKILHPQFDLYQVYSPKYEVWTDVTVCNSDDYDSFVNYYFNPENNNFFVGTLKYDCNYLHVCDNFYKFPENSIPKDYNTFRKLEEFCKEYEAEIFSSNSKIKKNGIIFKESEIKNSQYVKIFRISKDGFFQSNEIKSFLVHNENLYLFCLQEDEACYFVPVPQDLNTLFSQIVTESFHQTPINLNDYPAGYFFEEGKDKLD